MNTRTHAFALTCALSFATAATAAVGPPQPIDSEQKAARAIPLAQHLQYVAPSLASTFTSDGFTMGEGARRALLAATTPAALARTPGGITLACVRGGTLWARSTRAAPREIDIEFQDCVPYVSLSWVANGPLHLSLRSDSFVLEEIDGMRLGTVDRNFVVTQNYEFPGSRLQYTWTHNVVVQGRIDWPFHAQADLVPDRSQMHIHGTTSVQTRSERPGEEPWVGIVINTADNVNMSTSSTFGNDFEYEESQTTYLSGVITADEYPPTFRVTTTYEFAELSTSNAVDYLAWTESSTIQGGVRYTNVVANRSSCQNGDYLFRTKAPLHRPNLDSQAYDSGELVINRSLNMRLYSAANVPPGLPAPVNGMLMHLDVANVGTFDYDTATFGENLWSIAQCDF